MTANTVTNQDFERLEKAQNRFLSSVVFGKAPRLYYHLSAAAPRKPKSRIHEILKSRKAPGTKRLWR